MNGTQSDALVFFGATGDLRTRRSFRRCRRWPSAATLNVPVIGVAKAGWTLDQLRARAQDSVEKHGGLDRDAFDTASCAASLRRRRLQGSGDVRGAPPRARRRGAPRALSRDSAAAVRSGRGTTGAIGLREGRPRRRRKALRPGPRVGARPESDPARRVRGGRTSSGSITTSASAPFTTCCSLAFRIRSSRRSGIGRHVESVQITMAENFGVQGRGGFYDATGAIRDVIQNHLFQLLSNLAMEPPARMDSESPAGRKGEGPEVHSRAEGRRTSCADSSAATAQEPGVAADSQVETLRRGPAAASIRGDGRACPFYIRAGKCLPVTVHGGRRSACGSRQRCSRLRCRCRTTSASGSCPRQTVAFGVTAMDDGRPDDRPAGRARGEPAARR